MLLIEVLTGNYDLDHAVALKIAELKQRQKIDPVVNFKFHHNADNSEYLLDFIVSEGKSKLTMVEWNAYRYRLFKDGSGNHGVMIFGISLWETNKISQFLESLGTTRRTEINAMENFQIPSVEIK